MAVTLNELISLAGHKTAIRGMEYYLDHRVEQVSHEGNRYLFDARGSGNNRYSVSLEYTDSQNKTIENGMCSCPAFTDTRKPCKHIIAAATTLKADFENVPTKNSINAGNTSRRLEDLEYVDDELQRQIDYWNSQRLNVNNTSNTNGKIYGGNHLSKSNGGGSGNGITKPNKPTQPELRKSDRAAANILNSYAQRISDSVRLQTSGRSNLHNKPAKLEATLCLDEYDEVYLTFRVGSGKLYVLKDLAEFTSGFSSGKILNLGKKYSLALVRDSFEPDSQALLDFLLNNYSNHNGAYINNYGYYSYQRHSIKKLYLSGSKLDNFFSIVEDTTILVKRFKKPLEVAVRTHDPRLEIRIEKAVGPDDTDCQPAGMYMQYSRNGKQLQTDGFFLTASNNNRYLPGASQGYVLAGKNFYITSPEYHQACGPLFATLSEEDQLYFAKKDIPALLSTVIADVEPYLNVIMDDAASVLAPPPLQANVYFDIDDDYRVIAKTEFCYADKKHLAFMQKSPKESLDLATELRIESLLHSYLGYSIVAPGTIAINDEEQIYNLITTGIQRIKAVADVYASDAFDRLKLRKPATVSVGVRINGHLLDVDIDVDSVDFVELAAVLSSYRKAKKYHRMKDGSFLSLEDNAFEQLAEFAETLDVEAELIKNGHVSLDVNRALYLDYLFKKSEEIRYQRDNAFKDIIKNFRDVEDADFSVPECLADTLRNYQNLGFKWLKTLKALSLGGILADDMGLGKTLQVLALLQDAKETDPNTQPSIVVCPASLVLNWRSEAQRFTPDLRVAAVAGNAAERLEQLQAWSSFDLLVTSYDLLRRDIIYYQDIDFNHVVLDEAQYIKNQNTQNAKAVKLLQGHTRLALTGTPIENSLAELWSIFDFLMPGYLHNYHKFSNRFEKLIAKDHDPRITERLRSLVRPFILRRLKQDVLKELPQKIEQVQVASFEPEQRKVYLATLSQAKAELSEQLANAGSGQAHLMILAALTRLRQICCDPALVFDKYKGGSAKLSACMELVENCLESGHRMLLFSQFTSMLDIIERKLESRGIEYYRLDGSTPKTVRLNLVNSFNEGETPVFLISLKAGGTGLNLIGADVVIHYDPWWNLSVQNQATDRTHRIGQTNTVQVFKLIAQDTIEERIIELQQKKARLADSVVQESGDVFDSMSSKELMQLLEDRE